MQNAIINLKIYFILCFYIEVKPKFKYCFSKCILRYDDPINASPSRIADHLRPWDDEMMFGGGMDFLYICKYENPL